jgi:uncharacterized protein
LEDLWAPFKKKKKTRGMVAQEKGLEPLAEAMLELDTPSIEKKAAEFINVIEENGVINAELSVETAEAALAGARDILAERVSQEPDNRAAVRGFYMRSGTISVKGVGDESEEKTSVYQMYWDYSEALNQIKPHRVLAINRGEREEKLEVSINVDVDGAVDLLKHSYTTYNTHHADAIEDGLVRLLSPAVVREIRSDLSEEADSHGIGVFSENLKNLLMAPPIKGTRILGVDPGIRTGTKCATLDSTGKYLNHFVIYNHKIAEAEEAIFNAIKKDNIQLVAIGNGTGTREVQEIVSRVITTKFPEVLYTVVDEDGASVYSASDTAREEFPDLDLTIRGAISIGRRLQDPLAELVKIDPKSIGVGLYQHDVNQKKLSEMLDEVVGSVVNNVGVNLNTASFSLLKYVSGINGTLAKNIVAYRNEHGKIENRSDLMKIKGLGPKSFEQCAGFLKIPESANPLDNTWVHPENYSAAKVVYELVHAGNEVSGEVKKELKTTYTIGDQTITDIIEELKKPNRDPRDGYPKPIMQKGVVAFEDLKEGMMVTGKIKNVVDFGAFVDIGIKETALLHISELSDSYIADPMELLKVGDVKECRIIGLDLDRRRISLSLRSDSGSRNNASANQAGTATQNSAAQSGEKKRVVRVAKAGADKSGANSAKTSTAAAEKREDNRSDYNRGYQNQNRNDRNRNNQNRDRNYNDRNDDGMTYNPFAEAFKKMKGK